LPQNVELVSARDREPYLRTEVPFEPGFEARGHRPRVVVAGYEVHPQATLLLDVTQDLSRAGVGLALVDALRREDALEDLRGRLLAVSVEDLRPRGDGFQVERIACGLEHHLAHPGARIPDG
jgi:hypothetical protein